ncbi:hypothetical protein D9M70_292520 [compost metagenome]
MLIIGAGSLQHVEAVFEATQLVRPEGAVVGQRQKPRAQGQQHACEVAAVHCRHILRGQGLQRPGVVPVVEVPAVTVEAGHGRQGPFAALQQAPCAQVAEVIGGQVGQDGDPDIGR